ncbi:MAG: nuclear transport factor 2 family protein [Phenylobacterium sp.]|uniref:nuclear transport factor 2 family protein n=1 Tax=Phenylobacterium sp. TaxID=1871053 RepID=UPI001A4B0548|nr:nuclear transport factor 2 family protein [Phenylobacterium sp.]MBL8773843.1 nuclear transport factor 2 family protein [Phenylobacterium sp.]
MRPDILGPVRAYAEAWSRGDTAAVVAGYADDIVLHWGGSHALSGRHAGKVAALQALAEFGRRTQRRLVRVVDVMAGAERGVVIAREALGTPPVEVERVLVYRVAGGLLAECWVYDSDQALIDRLVGR